MKQEFQDRFDKAIAVLRPIEPSAYFDFEFHKKLEAAIAKEYQEAPWERIARRAAERLRYLFLPKTPVLVRAFATFVIVMTIGVYLNAARPASPIAGELCGAVLVRGEKDARFTEVAPDYKFKAGDIISTGEGAHIDLVLAKKYTIRIKDNSQLKIAKLTKRYGKGTALFELAKGRMLADIEPGFKPSGFIVNTEAATASAYGTKFSVDVSREEKEKVSVSVLDGKVEVKSHYRPKGTLAAKETVLVGPGQKTEALSDGVPLEPQRLIEEEWRQLEELYQIGRKPQVILLIKNTPDRVAQLLRPCPIYISDDKPRQISKLLEEAVGKIETALKTKDASKHLEAISALEHIVKEHPDASYNTQLLLCIGAYHEYLGYHKEAIKIFEKVVKRYPESTFASIAQCAIGVIYEERLNDLAKADEAYAAVLERYPDSLEAIWVELGQKKPAIKSKHS